MAERTAELTTVQILLTRRAELQDRFLNLGRFLMVGVERGIVPPVNGREGNSRWPTMDVRAKVVGVQRYVARETARESNLVGA